ncbi:MAG: hypothetical protein ABIN96_06460 [Rubrivivax sp.]
MTVASRVGWVGTAMAVTLASAALAWRDCLLLLIAGVLAHQVSVFRLSAAAAERPLQSILNVWMAGLAVAAAAALMGSCLLFASLGWWGPTVGSLTLAATATLAAVGWSLWSRVLTGDRGWQVWPWVGFGVLIASLAMNRGLLIAPCLLMLLTGSVLAWRGWQMAREAASSLGEGR